MTKEQMIAAATEYEAKLRRCVAESDPNLTDKDICHLLSMKCVQYEKEVQDYREENERLENGERSAAMKMARLLKPGLRLKIVQAGVNAHKQSDHCDDCGRKAVIDPESGSDLIETWSHTEALTLCSPCYRKRGNGVR